MVAYAMQKARVRRCITFDKWILNANTFANKALHTLQPILALFLPRPTWLRMHANHVKSIILTYVELFYLLRRVIS